MSPEAIGTDQPEEGGAEPRPTASTAPSEDFDASTRPYCERRTRWRRILQLFLPLPKRPRTPLPLPRREEIDHEFPTGLGDRELKVLVEQAQAVYAARSERAALAENRATTLLGAVGVSAGLVTAGAGLILDPAKVSDRQWRFALALALGWILLCFVMSGLLASRAILRFFTWERPEYRSVVELAASPGVEIMRRQIVDTLARAHQNWYVVEFKIAQIDAAGRWFRAALASLGVLAVLFTVYAAVGPVPS